MLSFNKFSLYTGNILVGLYIILAIINKQFLAIPQALIVSLLYTLLIFYWRSNILIDIEDEEAKQKEIEEIKKGIGNEKR